MASFAGWNSIVTAFDFFSSKYPKDEYVDITFYFPFGVMIGDFIAGIITPALAKKTTHKQRIAVSVFIIAVLCISLSFVAVWYNNWNGFWISLIILFFEGLFECITTHSLVALAG